MIAIDGPSGSGKSTLSATLRRSLPGSQLVDIEHFYTDIGVDPPDGLPPHEAYEQHVDWRALDAQVLRPLRRGEPGRYRLYDWIAEKRSASAEIKPEGIVLVDGIYSMRPELMDRLRPHRLRRDAPTRAHRTPGQAPGQPRLGRPLGRRLRLVHGPHASARSARTSSSPAKRWGDSPPTLTRPRCPQAAPIAIPSPHESRHQRPNQTQHPRRRHRLRRCQRRPLPCPNAGRSAKREVVFPRKKVFWICSCNVPHQL